MKKMSSKRSSSSTMTLKETAYRYLFEQGEEEEKKDEPAEDEAGGGDEAGDAGTEDTGGEDEATDAAPTGEDDEGGDKDEGDKDEKPKKKIPLEKKLELTDAIDQEIENILVKYEEEARDSAALNKERFGNQNESRSLRFLLRESDEDVDLHLFASNIARFINNYQNLIDWKSVILNKVESYITNHYDEDTAKSVLDILELDHGITKKEGQETPSDTPIALGATAGAAGGG